ncbi:MAG: putative rane-associated metal-dependent hydrolase [Herminiimonas sp.]|nr:putative rane-associated metal-dependent hydrolase [Herminiimonas sp.]
MYKPFSITPADKPGETKNRHSTIFNQKWPLAPVSSESLIVAASLFFSVFSNQAFWSALLSDRSWSVAGNWLFGGATFVIITAIHCALLALVINRWTAKPLLVVLFIANAMAAYYMRHYTVFFDAGMVRNILHTDVKEARELLSFNLIIQILVYGVVPGAFVMGIQFKQRSLRRAALVRAGFLVGSAILIVVCVALVFQDMAATMRNQKELRYLITPGNYLTSLARVLTADTNQARAARLPLGTDAALAASWDKRSKPALLIVVVGETARAANWGLNGYVRQTTPRLAASDVINYPHVSSCGTNTEVSLPCMFSPFGRKNYDEKKIRGHESLLHVLEHSGIKTLWRDNQSGCKGVCDGLEQQQLENSRHATLCDGERCLDEILLDNLEAELTRTKGNLVVVLHQLGNHGPAYYRRYPAAFRRFTPTCETADFGKCSQQEIVNSYDNALLYTDHFLDQAIQRLKAQRTHDAAMIYVSDHGESLGENGFYLHGLPYAMAQKEQTQVPMVMWLSDSFASSFGLDMDCLRKRASLPISHDYLFHSVLGLLQVKTQVYDKSYDLYASCRAG